MVLFVLLLTVLFGFAALTIDGSNAYMQQQRMQTAADAGALAGARTAALKGSDADVKSAVDHFSGSNGATTASWTYTANRRGIIVKAVRTYPTFFGSIIGHPNMTVSASAEAVFRPISGAGNLLPMAIDCNTTYTFGKSYRIWDKDDKKSPGGFGWLDWNGGSRGNPELVDNISNPANSPVLHIGDLIPSGPGVQNSSGVKNALDKWIGKPVTIPLYDVISGSGANTRYRVCGFAQFVLEGYNFTGNDKYVSGSFIQTLRAGIADDDAGLDRGIYTLVITR